MNSIPRLALAALSALSLASVVGASGLWWLDARADRRERRLLWERAYSAGQVATGLVHAQEVLRQKDAADARERARQAEQERLRIASEARLAALAQKLDRAREEAMRDPDYARCDPVLLPNSLRLDKALTAGDGDHSGPGEGPGGDDV